MKYSEYKSYDKVKYSNCYGIKISYEELDEAILLIPNCLKGCYHAQTRLYHIFSAPMLRLCLRFTKGNLSKAQDIAQEAFTKVYMHLHTLKSSRALHVWITRVFYSEAVDALRFSNRLKHRPNHFCVEVEEEMAFEDEDSHFEYQYDLNVMLRLLTKRYRSIFLMTANGCSYEDISIECHMPVGTVKSIVSRERAKIRKVYKGRHWLFV